MTIQKHEEIVDAEIVEDEAPLSTAEARELTDRISVNLDGLWEMVIEAFRRGAHRALGYKSWDEYCEVEFGSNRIKLPREERQETVRSLREAGLSIKSIGPALGIDRNTVRSDLRQGGEFHPPVGSVGADGKTYSTRMAEARERSERNAREARREWDEAQAKNAARPQPRPQMTDAEKLAAALNIVGRCIEMNHDVAEDDLDEYGWAVLRRLGLR